MQETEGKGRVLEHRPRSREPYEAPSVSQVDPHAVASKLYVDLDKARNMVRELEQLVDVIATNAAGLAAVMEAMATAGEDERGPERGA